MSSPKLRTILEESLGERPRATPASGIDAYVWVKPPGESDGSSSLIPNNEGKGFDQMYDEFDMERGIALAELLGDPEACGNLFQSLALAPSLAEQAVPLLEKFRADVRTPVPAASRRDERRTLKVPASTGARLHQSRAAASRRASSASSASSARAREPSPTCERQA